MHRMNVSSLRDNIAIVEQSTTLFPGSIFDNIAIGHKDASQEDVEAAAKLVCVHQLFCI